MASADGGGMVVDVADWRFVMFPNTRIMFGRLMDDSVAYRYQWWNLRTKRDERLSPEALVVFGSSAPRLRLYWVGV